MRECLVATVAVLARAFGLACTGDPNTVKPRHNAKGNEYIARQKFKEAIIEYRGATQVDARFAEGRMKLGRAYEALGDDTKALSEYVRAADLLPDDAGAQITAGNHLVLAGYFED